ncbi:MAG TPA: CbiX/SirB N-terminal domain-containing protein, partial [Thermohalobaculum sp.]|nr:CbiX/SirB N-terminal domain-containing protein [Thermohalobaculum sp.]
TTLAAPGALEAALGRLRSGARLLVFPHFMADGWFSTEELPRRLRKAGAGEFAILPAFGLDPAVHRLCLGLARDAVAAHAPGTAGLLLAAHGSPSDPRPAAAAYQAAKFLEASGTFREVRVGFIDEAPYLADAARMASPAVCLPYFAGRAGHVETDVPQALAKADFPGRLLQPVGFGPLVPGIIAAALARAATRRAA